MKPTLAQRFTSSCPTGGLPNLASTPTRRLSVVLLLALSLIAPGGPELLGAQGKKEPKSYLVVTPDAATLEVGQQSQLRAAVLDPVGFDLIPRKVTWHSSDPSIALVNSTGLVTAMAAGTVTIRAKSGPAMGTAAITVNGVVVPPPNTAPIVTITDPADGVSFPEGIPITFMGTAQDAQDGNLSHGIAWTISAANDPAAVQPPWAPAPPSARTRSPAAPTWSRRAWRTAAASPASRRWVSRGVLVRARNPAGRGLENTAGLTARRARVLRHVRASPCSITGVVGTRSIQ